MNRIAANRTRHGSCWFAWCALMLAAQAFADDRPSPAALQSDIAALKSTWQAAVQQNEGAAHELALPLADAQEAYTNFLLSDAAHADALRAAAIDFARTSVWLAGRHEATGEYAAARDAWQRLADLCQRALGKESTEYFDANQEAVAMRRVAQLPDANQRMQQVLSNKAELSRATRERDLVKAQELATHDHTLCSEIYGPTHPRTINSLEFVARVVFSRRQLNESFQLFEQAFELRKGHFTSAHPSFVKSALDLGARHESVNQLEQAEVKYREVSDCLQKFSCLVRLASKYDAAGLPQSAARIYDEVWLQCGATIGDEHPLRALAGTNVGDLRRRLGEFRQAEERLEASAELWRANDNRRELANCLSGLALTNQQLADYERAESCYLEAIDCASGDKAHRSVDFAIRTNYASLLEELGRYPEARRIYETLLAGIEEDEKDAQLISLSLNARENLGRLYQTVGELQKAELQLNALVDLQPSRTARQASRTLTLRGRLYLQIDALDRAMLDFDAALMMLDDDPNCTELDRAAVRSLQALVHVRRGEFAEALTIYSGVLATYEEFYGKDHVSCAEIHDQLAKSLRGERRFDDARAAHQRAMEIYAARQGAQHETVAWALHRLGTTEFFAGQIQEAYRNWRQAFEIKQSLVQEVLPWLPEAQAAAYLTSLTTDDSSGGRDALLSALSSDLRGNAIVAFDIAWRSRGLVLDQIAKRQRQTLNLQGHGGQRTQLATVRRQLAQLSLTQTNDTRQQQARAERMRELSSQKEELERNLAEHAGFDLADVERWSPNDLMRQLGPETAFVQFARTYRWHAVGDATAEVTKVAHYDAFICKYQPACDGYDIAWVPLGPAVEIDEHIQTWRAEILSLTGTARGKRVKSSTPVAQTAGQSRQFIAEHVWRPVAAELGQLTEIIIVPDGEMHGIPWCALPAENSNGLLIEQYQITTAADGRQLAGSLQAAAQQAGRTPSSSTEFLLVGGVDYDLQLETPHLGVARQARASTWPYLPGTAEEIRAIAETLGSEADDLLDGGKSLESLIKQRLHAARFVHFATHGFFADDELESDVALESNAEDEPQQQFTARQSLAGRHPLLRCGLTLAGCNQDLWLDESGLPITTGEDGLLTAEELMGMDLRGVELVVLSACETGLGTVASGEGVFGLQRALHISGVQSTIASQWKVDDNATKLLMIEFYDALHRQGMGKAAALRHAQLTLLKHFDPSTGSLSDTEVRAAPAYYWAAFSLSGLVD